MVVLAVALVSPLDSMSESLLAAHMVQHLLLVMIAPPLLLLGQPGRMAMWALPSSWRQRLMGWTVAHRWLGGGIRLARRVLAVGWVAWLLHTAAIWGWHAPIPYQAALASSTVHFLEHSSFMVTALLVWAIVLRGATSVRTGGGAALLVLLASMVQSGGLGALLLFSRRVWYPLQAVRPTDFGLTPLQDQQLAGLIMWVPGGFIYLGAAVWVLAAWLGGPSRRPFRIPPSFPRMLGTAGMILTALALLGTLSGCQPVSSASGLLITGVDGNPDRGKAAMEKVGCGGCHDIGGIPRAAGRVGPPLRHLAGRVIIAGHLPNTVSNAVRWIRSPSSINPQTAMPTQVTDEQTARDIVAYLYTKQ
jgi:cytochrome c oxidase assembly factor CtaG/cytochrome c2